MAQLTLLDIAKRNGSDPEIGLIEDVVTYAPELGVFPVRPLQGVSYKSTLRTAYPAAAFRAVGNGVVPGKSSYVQKLSECFYLDGQLQVDEALPDSEDRSVGDVLADEASGQMAGIGITAASQIYYGTSSDANGFVGLTTFVGSSSSLTVAGGGTSGGTGTLTSAWLVYMDRQGLHLVAGRTAGATAGGEVAQAAGEEPVVIAPPFQMGGWRKQQVVIGTAGKVAMAWVNNFAGWLGLAYGSDYSAFRIRNLNVSAGNTTMYLTDTKAAQLLSKVPIRIRNSGRLRWFMNRDAAFSLQASRFPTTVVGAVGAGGVFPDLPKELGGIPVTVTDSIVSTENFI